MKYDVIIPAAGMGSRMQQDKNKVLLTLNHQSVLEHTIAVFEQHDACAHIHLAVRKDEMNDVKQLTNRFSKIGVITEGGTERQFSIFNVLKKIEPCQYVFVHDAARPFVSSHLLDRLTDGVTAHQAVIAAVRVKDTIKQVKDGKVQTTIPRETLWQVQTPQAFSYDLLMKANMHAENNEFTGTDDASLVEYFGHDVHIVAGDYDNIKLTTPEDMFFAEAIMKKVGSQCSK